MLQEPKKAKNYFSLRPKFRTRIMDNVGAGDVIDGRFRKLLIPVRRNPHSTKLATLAEDLGFVKHVTRKSPSSKLSFSALPNAGSRQQFVDKFYVRFRVDLDETREVDRTTRTSR